MVFIGLISYPLYLWHWPILAYYNIIAPQGDSLLTKCVVIVSSLLLAWLTYAFIEKPIRLSKASKKMGLLLLLFLFAIGVSGYLIIHFQGLPKRAFVQQKNVALKDFANFENYRKTAISCDIEGKQYQDFSWCLQSKKERVNIALWGDSHADHLFPGIIKSDKKNNWLLIGHTTCPPLLGVKAYLNGTSEETCFEKNQLAFNAIVNNENIQTVVLASLGPFYINNTNFAAEHVADDLAGKFRMKIATATNEDQDSRRDVFYYGLNNTITELAKKGKKVVIFQDTPEVPFFPMACITRPLAPKKLIALLLQKKHYNDKPNIDCCC